MLWPPTLTKPPAGMPGGLFSAQSLEGAIPPTRMMIPVTGPGPTRIRGAFLGGQPAPPPPRHAVTGRLYINASCVGRLHLVARLTATSGRMRTLDVASRARSIQCRENPQSTFSASLPLRSRPRPSVTAGRSDALPAVGNSGPRGLDLAARELKMNLEASVRAVPRRVATTSTGRA